MVLSNNRGTTTCTRRIPTGTRRNAGVCALLSLLGWVVLLTTGCGGDHASSEVWSESVSALESRPLDCPTGPGWCLHPGVDVTLDPAAGSVPLSDTLAGRDEAAQPFMADATGYPGRLQFYVIPERIHGVGAAAELRVEVRRLVGGRVAPTPLARGKVPLSSIPCPADPIDATRCRPDPVRLDLALVPLPGTTGGIEGASAGKQPNIYAVWWGLTSGSGATLRLVTVDGAVPAPGLLGVLAGSARRSSASLPALVWRTLAQKSIPASLHVDVLPTGGCDNARRDGDETDVDCGGTCPTACRQGKRCLVDRDCAGGAPCITGSTGRSCGVAPCEDRRVTGAESDVDCGGGSCPRCGTGRLCDADSDCVSKACHPVTHRCLPATCGDGVAGGGETDRDCGGSCAPCPPGLSCRTGVDCLSGVCAQGRCAMATCSDRTMNGGESDVDCGGPCAPCSADRTCRIDGDCVSLSCDSQGARSVCRPPSCANGRLDPGEADVDCGGACPDRCTAGRKCDPARVVPSDCDAAGACLEGLCRLRTCADGVLGGTETDVDCGGSCLACRAGRGCIKASDCLSGVCSQRMCASASCSDRIRNGTETDVDCGGECAVRCAEARRCRQDPDCDQSVRPLFCVAGTCRRASTTDGIRNGSETDVDCGGTGAGACADGRRCQAGRDCVSGRCEQSICAPPTCGDHLANGTESDIDCGGSCVLGCALGARCSADADCLSRVCRAGRCAAATCTDRRRNQGEADVDCGGPCAPCRLGLRCAAASDCLSGRCDAVSGRCGAASCDDGLRNGAEVDVDCGGNCGRCGPGRVCRARTDCDAVPCVAGVCAAPSCSDGLVNGTESDVDCGGSCATCPERRQCRSGADCGSGRCIGGRCESAACGDGALSPGEIDVDCGGVCDARCAAGRACRAAADCVSLECRGGRCAVARCDDRKKNGSETDIDCGGGCAPCGGGRRCAQGGDCDSGVCSAGGVCLAPSCADGLRNGDESDIDCGSACPARCAPGSTCVRSDHCSSGLCVAGTCAEAGSSDGVRNGQETDLDCGGPDAPVCSPGRRCGRSRDCGCGAMCQGSLCVCPTGGCAPGCDDPSPETSSCGEDACNTPPGVCRGSGRCAEGRCEYPPLPSGTRCPTDNPCAAGACDGAGACRVTAVADGTRCPAGVCRAGSCTAGCVIDGVVVDAGARPTQRCLVCDPRSSVTAWSPLAANTACDDGDVCSYGDRCNGAGRCVATPYACRPGACVAQSTCNGTGGCNLMLAPRGTVCRPAADVCDPVEVCSGMDASCPSDIPAVERQPDGSCAP